MIGVDLIGQIRRAYFEQRRPIKEIVRLLSVSRATVRKVIRGKKTEFRYERSVQPAPKLGEWIEVLTAILEREAKLPRRERRSRRGSLASFSRMPVRTATHSPSFGAGCTERSYLNSVSCPRITLRTVVRDTDSSRTISLIGRRCSK